MLDDNVLIRSIIGVIFAILMAISLTLTIYARTSVDIITDRENLRVWLTDEDVQYELIDYIIDKAFSPLTLDIAGKILGDETYNNLLHSELVENSAETITNNTIDTLYDWMEGEIDSPELVLKEKNKEDLVVSPLSALLDEKLGFLNDYIDVGELINSNESLSLVEISPEKLVGIQKTYQSIQKIPQALLFITLVLTTLLMLALTSWRHRLFFLGLVFLGSGILLIWGNNFITYDSLASSKILDSMGYSLPSLDSLPKFIQLSLSKASFQIVDQSKEYGKYLLVGGLILSVLSQLAVSDVETKEYGIDESESSGDAELDYDTEELEESEEE